MRASSRENLKQPIRKRRCVICDAPAERFNPHLGWLCTDCELLDSLWFFKPRRSGKRIPVALPRIFAKAKAENSIRLKPGADRSKRGEGHGD